ncbi:Hypothetical predicted protein, partial [Marmota monax]
MTPTSVVPQMSPERGIRCFYKEEPGVWNQVYTPRDLTGGPSCHDFPDFSLLFLNVNHDGETCTVQREK